MLPPHVGLSLKISKSYEFLTSLWLPWSTPSSHHLRVPVESWQYHSIRCQTPSVTRVASTFGSRHRKSPGYSGSTWSRPSGRRMRNCWPPSPPPPLNMKAILLPLGPRSNGDDGFHQSPT